MKEVAVLAASQVTQMLVLCLLVEEVGMSQQSAPTYPQLLKALVLIGIGTQGPRVLRRFAWSGDNGMLSGLPAQVASRLVKVPW
jgi:hypothetical protein